jgi:PKD repeat protein
MKKNLFIFYFLLSFTNSISAQVTGPDSVCSGMIYSYDANIPGADSLTWTFPVGWHQLNITGTQVEVLCNKNIGQICATGFDSLGNNLGQHCIQVVWGGSGSGWHVQTQIVYPTCSCHNYTASVIPDPGTACGVCTEGYLSPNLRYGIYASPWPSTQFRGYADSNTQFGSQNTGIAYTFYVYQIDITFGINNAILIEGGLCTAPVNNVFTIPGCWPTNLGITATPDPVCVGDTVTLAYDHLHPTFPTLPNYSWYVTSGYARLIPPYGLDHIQCIIDSAAPVYIQMSSYYGNCGIAGWRTLNYVTCASIPVASFQPDSVPFCAGTCIDFINTSVNATSYQWLFPGGNPSSDTTVNPHNVCYYTGGIYDVTLIAGNSAGYDTTILHNALTVHPQIPFSAITQTADTLFSIPGYIFYQWYSDTTLIPGANNYYYVAHQNGNYGVQVSDSNGCYATAYLSNVVTSVNANENFIESIHASSVNGEIRLYVHSSKSISSTILLLDVMGREIFKKEIILSNGNNVIAFNDLLSRGIYFIKADMICRISTFKIFVE